MGSVLNETQITEVEAVYLCVIDPQTPFDLKVGLIKRLYDVNPYMFVYIEWLLSRWLPLYAKFKTHLPRKFPKQSYIYSPHRPLV